MKFTLILLSSFLAVANGARYGLLRVGTPAAGKAKAITRSTERSLFDEDFHAVLRELFGSAGLSLSTPGAGLSLSMPELSMPTSTPAPTVQDTASPVAAPVSPAPTGAIETIPPSTDAPEETESPTAAPTDPDTASPTPDSTLPVVAATVTEQQAATGREITPTGIAAVVIGCVAVVAVAAALVARKMHKNAARSQGSLSDGSSMQSSSDSPEAMDGGDGMQDVQI